MSKIRTIVLGVSHDINREEIKEVVDINTFYSEIYAHKDEIEKEGRNLFFNFLYDEYSYEFNEFKHINFIDMDLSLENHQIAIFKDTIIENSVIHDAGNEIELINSEFRNVTFKNISTYTIYNSTFINCKFKNKKGIDFDIKDHSNNEFDSNTVKHMDRKFKKLIQRKPKGVK